MVSWAALLQEAVTKPSYIHEAYRRFPFVLARESTLGLFQCFERSIQPGPLATFPKWKQSGRHVGKGEKALTLCMPITCMRTKTVTAEDGTEQAEEFACTHFTYKAPLVRSAADGGRGISTRRSAGMERADRTCPPEHPA